MMEIMEAIAGMLIIVFGSIMGVVVLGAAAFYWCVFQALLHYNKDN